MGTIIGLLILAGISVFLKRQTGLHLHEGVTEKYKESQDKK